MHLLLVMLGGAIGAGFRFQIGRIALMQLGTHFPYGTWIVNLVGGFLMGVLTGSLARFTPIEGEPLRLFLGIGVLGGFTTYSSFSLETYNMLLRGDYALAGSYAVSTAAGSILMVGLGLIATRALG